MTQTVPMRDEQLTASAALSKTLRTFLIGKMGSGKTRVACHALATVVSDTRASCWIVGPPAVIAQWPEELARHGIAFERYKKDAQPKAPVVLLNFGELASAIRKRINPRTGRNAYVFHLPPPQIFIVDESRKLAGLKMRGGSAQGYNSKLAADQAARVWLLTANPVVDSIVDAWSQLLLLGGSGGRSRTEFIERYCYYAANDFEKRKPLALPGSAEKVSELIAAQTIALRSPDVTVEAMEKVVTCALSPDGLARYRQLLRDRIIGGRATAGAAHVFCLAHQLASGVAYEPREPDQPDGPRVLHRVECNKANKLREVVSAYIAAGENVLISYVYEHQHDDIIAALDGLCPSAKVKKITAGALVKAWNAGSIRIGLAHPRSLGHGVNMQDGGRVLIVYSEHFSADAHTQMLERLGALRQQLSGYTRQAHVIYMRTAHTLDEHICAVRDDKLTNVDAVNAAIKGVIS